MPAPTVFRSTLHAPRSTPPAVQATLDWSSDELARRSYLHDLIARLFVVGVDRLTWQIRTVEPFGVTGLVVTARGIAGAAQVLPATVTAAGGQERRGYGAFPGAGEPHYELRIIDGPADGWASRPSLYFLSADPGQVAAAIGAWRDATPQPRLVTPPLGPADLAPLRALAVARHALNAGLPLAPGWATLGLRLGFDRDDPPGELTPAARDCLTADLDALDPVRLLANMPRDERGRLALGAAVLLASYDSAAALPHGRRPWLVARAPARRRDPQVVTLDLAILPGGEHRHRWDAARWLWDRRAEADEAARWGVTGLNLRRLGLCGRATELARLRERQQRGDLVPAECVALCLLLQDEGQLEAACAACGVELAEEVLGMVQGGQGRCLSDKEATLWPRALQAALRAAAPWRFAALLDAEEARLAAAHPGKRRRPNARLRLCDLPNQRGSARLALMLARAADGRTPRLELEATSTKSYLPEVAWRRALDLDLRRFGLG